MNAIEKIKNALPKGLYSAVLPYATHNIWLDWLTIACVFLLFVGGVFLSSYIHQWFLYVLFIILQGGIIHQLAVLIHDYYVHSKVLPYWLAYIAGALISLMPTVYKKEHIVHHKMTPNSLGDPDRCVNEPNQKHIEKIIAYTVLGELLFIIRKKIFKCISQTLTPKEKLYGRFEIMGFYIFTTIAILLFVFNIHSAFFYGWFLPLILGAPLYVGLRKFTEHGLSNSQNPLALGTPIKAPRWLYYTPFISFYGEGHLIHHSFPVIPWYNYWNVAKIIRPYLEIHLGYKKFSRAYKEWWFTSTR